MGLAQENTTMLVGLGFQYTFPGYINNNKKHSEILITTLSEVVSDKDDLRLS